MNPTVLSLLELVQGPLFRATLALLVLGTLRNWIFAVSDTCGAYIAMQDKPAFWRKLRLRLTWHLTPSLLLKRVHPEAVHYQAYHITLCCLSMVLRVGAIIIPTFMLAHVYLWERGLGVSWPALPGAVSNIGAMITIGAGILLFFGRLYSPVLREIEPTWAFTKPLILVAPFLTGFLTMHPRLSPFSWHFVMLLHMSSACLVFVMVPFGRLLSCMHPRVTEVLPEAAWLPATESAASESPATELQPGMEVGGHS